MESFNELATTIKEEPMNLDEMCRGMQIETGMWNKETTGVRKLTDLVGMEKEDIGEIFPNASDP